MPEREVKRIPKSEVDRQREQEEYQRRHEVSLLKILIQKMPEDARRLVKELTGAAV